MSFLNFKNIFRKNPNRNFDSNKKNNKGKQKDSDDNNENKEEDGTKANKATVASMYDYHQGLNKLFFCVSII